MKRIALLATTAALATACATAKPEAKVEPTDPGLFVARQAAIDALMRNFSRVNFEFDSALITPETRDALAANAEIMMAFEELGVEVQGHCDHTGSTEYNLALGERRAAAIAKYLVTAGVAPFRVTTISYGEERPLSFDDDALASNRRAEFRVTVGEPAEVRGSVEDEILSEVELVFEPETLAAR